MIRTSTRRSVKRVSRQFRPVLSNPTADMILERRNLTAPAFFRAPGPWDPSTGDYAEAQSRSLLDVQEFDAYVAETWRDEPTGSTTTGSATCSVVDLANPAPPENPVGTYTTSMNSASLIQWAGGDHGIPFMGLDTRARRSYQIADPSGPSSGWKVEESYRLDYLAPSFSMIESEPEFRMSATLESPSLRIIVGGIVEIGGVSVNGVVVSELAPSVSHTFTDGDTMITASWTPATVTVAAWTPLGTVPEANSNPVNGTAWSVYSYTHMGMAGNAREGVMELQQQLSTHYEASFSTN